MKKDTLLKGIVHILDLFNLKDSDFITNVEILEEMRQIQITYRNEEKIVVPFFFNYLLYIDRMGKNYINFISEFNMEYENVTLNLKSSILRDIWISILWFFFGISNPNNILSTVFLTLLFCLLLSFDTFLYLYRRKLKLYKKRFELINQFLKNKEEYHVFVEDPALHEIVSWPLISVEMAYDVEDKKNLKGISQVFTSLEKEKKQEELQRMINKLSKKSYL